MVVDGDPVTIAVWLRALDRVVRLRWSFGVASVFDRTAVRRVHVKLTIDKGHLLGLALKAS